MIRVAVSWFLCAIVVSNTKVNLPQPLPLQLGRNQDNHSMVKVTMNKLCARLFIIIFIDVFHKSEYIPTVTNFASILANCFYFLRKITALWPSVLNF